MEPRLTTPTAASTASKGATISVPDPFSLSASQENPDGRGGIVSMGKSYSLVHGLLHFNMHNMW